MRCGAKGLAAPWVVCRVHVFEAKRPNGRYLCDVLTGLGPVEVGRTAGQDDDATGRVRDQVVVVELVAQPIATFPLLAVSKGPTSTSSSHLWEPRVAALGGWRADRGLTSRWTDRT